MKADRSAWADWQRRTPSYRKAAMGWMVSAKQEATRQRRLGRLIATWAEGEGLPALVKYT